MKVYADEGISGTKTKNRKQFLQLMRDSNCNLFEMVAVKDISRLARNAVDFLQCIRELKSKGIACKFVNANLDSQDSEMILGTLALVAQEESANTSKRIKFSKKINAEKGRVPNLVYGYDKTKGDYFNLAINPKEADIVRRIYHLYLHEGMGQLRIAQMLNSEGVLTKRNCCWSQNSISRILQNEIYIGKIINGKQEISDFLTGVRKEKDQQDWIVTQRPELQIIDNATFEQVQKIQRKKHNDFSRKAERRSSKHIFSTLIKCTCCGYSYRRIERTYKNTYIDWVCSGRNINGAASCPNKTVIREAELLEEIRSYFISLLADKPKVVSNVVKEFNRIYQSQDSNLSSEKAITDRLNRLKRDKQKYEDMHLNEIITLQELKEKTADIIGETNRLENELKMIQLNLSKGDRLEKVLENTFKDIESLVDMENMTNVMLKRVVQKIEVNQYGNVDIYLKLFSEIGLGEKVLICNDET